VFVSITFPLADFRGLASDRCGRLDRPSWGSADPRASFARGFGAIHTRNKSGSRFVGEDYYADCNNLVKYPSQIFLTPLWQSPRKVLLYPVYRRFFFDGQVSGRFEFGFRLNGATLAEIYDTHPDAEYDISAIAAPVLIKSVVVNLLDGRSPEVPLYHSSELLRDGYLMSSTKQKELAVHDVASVGSRYVSVGSPFVFIRAGRETKLRQIKLRRDLLRGLDYSFFRTRLKIKGQELDTVVLSSNRELSSEAPKERLARLFYSQIRALTFAHSHYLSKLSDGKVNRPAHLGPSIKAMIERIKSLSPLDGDPRDADTCADMRQILDNADVDVERLAREIERYFQPSRLRAFASMFFGYVDRKADKAIEAAASTATKQMLSSGP
jgi:hypothetical protein